MRPFLLQHFYLPQLLIKHCQSDRSLGYSSTDAPIYLRLYPALILLVRNNIWVLERMCYNNQQGQIYSLSL